MLSLHIGSDISFPESNLLLLIVGALIMCAMAFGIGANDVANAWGTSVGSGALRLRTACLIAGLMDWLGAITLGYGVSSKITKGVATVGTPECWACGCTNSFMGVYAWGMLAALIAAAIFLLLATFTAMPVSTTHAIVGGVVGVTMMGVGPSCLNWAYDGGLGGIVASWVISPVLSGIIGAMMYTMTDRWIMKSSFPLKRAILAVPALYALTALVLTYMIMIKAGPTKKLDYWVHYVVAVTMSLVIGIVAVLVVVPNIKKNLPSVTGLSGRASTDLDDKMALRGANVLAGDEEGEGADMALDMRSNRNSTGILKEVTSKASTIVNEALAAEDRETSNDVKDAVFCFRYLLVFNAALESFAHGANDTANSTAAFSAIVNSYNNGLYACEANATPWWIMGVGGFFVLVGINVIGHKVIETIGENVTAINFHRGFCIEFASTATVVIATLLDFPVSTTHCQIGAVAFVGFAAFGTEKVEWKLLGQILVSWIITIPFAAIVSAIFTSIFGFMNLNRDQV